MSIMGNTQSLASRKNYSDQTSVWNNSWSDFAKYFAVILPVATAIAEGMAYLKWRILYNLLGITIAPQIDPFSVLLAGLSLSSIIFTIGLPTMFLVLERDQFLKSERRFYTLIFIIFPVGLLIGALLGGRNLRVGIIEAISLLVLSTIMPLLIAGVFFKKDPLELFVARNQSLVVLKAVGVGVVGLFAFVMVVNAKTIEDASLVEEHNIVAYQSNRYVIVSQENGNFLLSKLCKDNRIVRGSFRFVSTSSVDDSTIAKFALSSTCNS